MSLSGRRLIITFVARNVKLICVGVKNAEPSYRRSRASHHPAQWAFKDYTGISSTHVQMSLPDRSLLITVALLISISRLEFD